MPTRSRYEWGAGGWPQDCFILTRLPSKRCQLLASGVNHLWLVVNAVFCDKAHRRLFQLSLGATWLALAGGSRVLWAPGLPGPMNFLWKAVLLIAFNISIPYWAMTPQAAVLPLALDCVVLQGAQDAAVLHMESDGGWWCSLDVSVELPIAFIWAGESDTTLLFQVSLLCSCCPPAWISRKIVLVVSFQKDEGSLYRPC